MSQPMIEKRHEVRVALRAVGVWGAMSGPPTY
jgi:hypothetical protein